MMISMLKTDYKSELKQFYKPGRRHVEKVDVPEMQFVMIDGDGAPGGLSYAHAVEALYSVSYTLKFMVKRELALMDYGVMPLEGLWWAEDMSDFITRKKDRWLWTLMIMQPACITSAMFGTALARVRLKKELPALDRLSFVPFCEGPAAQILHVGSFDEEGPAVERVHKFIEESNRKLTGKHHEIYLTDIRRAAPVNWRTVIRQPMV